MRRAMTLLLCLFLLFTTSWTPSLASGGKVVLGKFTDGDATRTYVFAAPGSNSSAQLELPKAATIVKASIDITGQPLLQNISIIADTKDDFASSTLSNLDINTSEGELKLQTDNSWDDEFDGSDLDQRWMWFNTPYAYDLGVNRSGHLHIASQKMTNFGQSADSGVLVYQSVSGGFYVETKIVSAPQNNFEKSGIMVRQDSNNWVALKYQAENGAKVQLTRKIGGAATDTMVAVSASPIFMGLERSGNSFSCQYSTDGGNWTALSGGPWTVQLTNPVSVGLIVADGSANTNYAVDYDYFRLDKYCGNGSLLSGWTEAPGNVAQARATCSGILNPLNASFTLSARTGPANPWQALMPGITTQLAPPGANLSYKIEMTSEGVHTPDLYELRINFSVLRFPSDVSVALGPGAPFWTQPGELNATRTVDLKEAIAAFLTGATPEPDGNATIPLNLTSSAIGTLVLQNLTVEYLIGVPPTAPTLLSPVPGAYISATPPILSLEAGDADNDPLLFMVELSDDGFHTVTSYNQTASGAGWSKGNRTYRPGEEASLRPSMSFVDGRAYSWRARAFDGAYWSPYSEVRSFTIDTSPPLGGPRDGGNLTDVPDSLTATLDFHDNESGVESYEYWIGTGPGAWDVVANTATPNASVKVTGLSLSMGMTYYITARARNLAGLWSACATTDGIMYWPAGVESVRIRIDQPAAGSNLSEVASISGTAWLRDGWTRNHTVQVRIDDGPWKNATFTGAPSTYGRNWTLKWDTTQVSDGIHLVWAHIALGFTEGTEIAITNVSVKVTNTVPPPPVPVLEADFTPGDNVTLSIPENSSFEFSFQTDAQAPIIAWTVDGVKRPVEVYPKFVFLASYSSAGVHTISVLIRSGNLSLEHNWTLNVTNVNQPPLAAVLTPLANSVWKAGEAITFNASSSGDPDLEDRLGYNWVFGDGAALNGSVVIHVYKKPGSYQVILTVSDGQLESYNYLNLTISPPDEAVQAAGDPIYLMGLLAIILMVATASGGGYWYLRKRKAVVSERMRARAAEEELAANRPATPPSDEDEDAGEPALKTPTEEAKRTPAGTPVVSPLYDAPAPHPAKVTEALSFEAIPEAEALPPVEAMEMEPIPMAPLQQVRQASRPPTPATAPPPFKHPTVSQAPKATAPATRPAVSAAPVPPAKKAESLEEILAILNGK